MSDAPAQRLDYGDKLTVSCAVEVADADDFKTLCESTTARKDLWIFYQFINSFHFLGIFGNAQINYEQDWVQTVRNSTDNLEVAGVYDETKKSCKQFTSSLEVEILTSKVGFEDELQDYIVGAKVTAVEHDWIYDPTQSPQTFSYYASVSFREVLPDSYETQSGFETMD